MNPHLRFSDYNDKWQTSPLGDLAQIYDGTHQTPKYVAKGVPFYSVEQVTANNFKDTKFISEEVFSKENNRPEKGDILMTRIGDIGTSRYLDWDVRASFYVSLALIKKSEKIDSAFLDQCISTDSFQRELWRRTIHVAFPKKINLGEIGHCIISYPSLEEQQKIANFLTLVDNKISTLEQKIERIETYKLGVMQKIFSRKALFDRNNELPSTKQSGIKLGDLVDFINGYTFSSTTYDPNGRYKIITIANVQQGRMDATSTNRINDLPDNIQPQQILSRGDILISMTGNVGRVCLVNQDNCLLNQRVGKLVPRDIDKDFLYHSINSRSFVSKMISSGQGGAQDNLSSKDIKNYRIEVPHIEDQQKIANLLSALDQKITLTSEQLKKNKEFKKGLLQRMFV